MIFLAGFLLGGVVFCALGFIVGACLAKANQVCPACQARAVDRLMKTVKELEDDRTKIVDTQDA